ncbi:ABC-2 type transport system ATP-binding protein [Streptomyces sp. 2112.3]|uniref:ATP-binding cassette domain-containing protein n=1 Tax=Streptomyces sp. 2112.3 TaxID=1881023 RepID=UPI00089722EB|nr:ABC-2 type transport system ATP-binding protein [Streptomyces sp. 2112.3]
MRPVGTDEVAGRASGRTAVEAIGLGRRHRRRWALREGTFRLPAGRICALVGPSGAGKSTLLSLLSGLTRPSEGAVRIGGEDPAGAAARARTAHVTQGNPLYPRLTVAETLRMGRALNPGRWNGACAERIVREGRLPLDARAGALSGGQRTRLGLALAFARSPELLLLDEPLAGLDPIARHRFTALLLAQAAEHGTTVVLSSDLLAELDGVCDYLLLLGGGRVRLAGEVDDVIGAHALVMGAHRDGALPPAIAAHTVVETQTSGRHFTTVVRRKGTVAAGPWETAEPSLEELLLAYLRAPDAPDAPDAPPLIAPGAEPVPARRRRRPGSNPGIPGMPRNGPPRPAGRTGGRSGRSGWSGWNSPPGGAAGTRHDPPGTRHDPPGTRHDHHSGKGAAA